MKHKYENLVVIIPAYNPDQKLIQTLKNLISAGFEKVILVNDGSKEECMSVFSEASSILESLPEGILLKHSVNLGQGRAYKTAFNYYLEHFPDTIGVIQCDADGQHHIEDINKCAELLRSNPQKFILGVRNFSDKTIPFRSRFGNNCTSFVFKVFCGMDLKDTQTGLKGIPKSFVPILMETPGERFEYASSCLLETKKHGIDILQFSIQTIYIGNNETSHFNPVMDSIRIFSLILKYLMSSLSAFIVDIVTFSIFLAVFKGLLPKTYIIISTYLAKVISCTYSFLVNKNFVFEHRGNGIFTAVKYIMLCVVQATISGFLTNALVGLMRWDEVLSKIIIDTLLFFVSFQVQNRWVFKNVHKD